MVHIKHFVEPDVGWILMFIFNLNKVIIVIISYFRVKMWGQLLFLSLEALHINLWLKSKHWTWRDLCYICTYWIKTPTLQIFERFNKTEIFFNIELLISIIKMFTYNMYYCFLNLNLRYEIIFTQVTLIRQKMKFKSQD